MKLIVTVLTDDKPGVIEQVSAVIAGYGGSWRNARMAQMEGKFAGIIAVDAPEAQAGPLQDRLRALPGIVVHIAGAGAGPFAAARSRHMLHVVANDRPGIVAEVSRALASAGVNVAELATSVEPASMSGGVIFRAVIEVGLTDDQRLPDVIACLEGLSDDLMIDVVGD